MTPRIGSLCSGYGGLELGLMAVVGGSVAWHVEYDKHPSAVLEARFPGVPNYGDVTTTDWTQVEPVDWLTAGYPCQPFSHAGKRKGSADERHLWPAVADAIGVLRPRRVLLENVAGHVSLGLDAVLADLAALGYDATWGVVRASDAGAAHRRERIFIVAADSGRAGAGRNGRAVPRAATSIGRPGANVPPTRHGSGDAAAHAAGKGQERDKGSGRQGRRPEPARSSRADGDATLSGVTNEPVGGHTPGQHERSIAGAVPGDSAGAATEGVPVLGRAAPVMAWGKYAGAIRRWERVTGRPAPDPTGDNYPRFVEWHMGLPEGWVTNVLPRNPALKCLGNGVVPQQAALAVRTLLTVGSVAA